MIKLSHWVFLLVALLVGCTPTYAPISIDDAKAIESGTPLSEIESILGPSHPPTSTQEQALDGILERMRPETRANAESDQTLAWGDEKGFLVGKVNDAGIVWALAWRSN